MKNLTVLFIFLSLFIGKACAQVSPVTGPSVVCTGSTITLHDATAGGTWSSHTTAIATIDATTGIVTGVSAGVDSIMYITGSGGVIYPITVNPTPALTSPLTPPAICDSSVFSYVPTGSIGSPVFAWSRAFITGIAGTSSSGLGNPDEELINTTAFPIAVTYVYITSLGGCADTQNVTVVVNPTPVLSGSLTLPAICDSSFVNYTPGSLTPGTLFSWDRPEIAGINPPTSFSPMGSGVISELLTNTTINPIVVTYIFRLSVNGCINRGTQSVTITIDTCAATLGIYNVSGADEDIQVYPNPANGQFTITCNGLIKEKAEADIYNIAGQLFHKEVFGGMGLTVSVADYPPGVYICKAVIDGRVYVKKLTVY